MYSSNGIQDTSLFRFPDNIFTNPSSTNQDFSSSSLLNVFPSQLIGLNDETMFLQDFHDNLHEGASNTNMIKVADDIYSNKNSNVKKRKFSSGGSTNVCEQIRINRSCKKDRHSKITTADGSLRGRRMRLSLNVAKEFFTLQDLLRFDTASKTVEWLLKKCENAIKEVTAKRAFGMMHSPCPSTSVLSATDELEPVATTKEETKGGTQKVNASHLLKRGLREKARARARKRTQEKKRLQLDGGFTDHNDRSRLYNCSRRMNVRGHCPLLSCEKSAAAGKTFVNMSSTTDPAPVLEVKDLLNYSKQQPDSFEGSTNTEELMTDHSFFISNNWNPYTIFNFHHNPGTISYELQHHQFTSFLQYEENSQNTGAI